MDNITQATTLLNANPTSENREIQKRDYLYASELGKSDIDVYLAMNGVPYSNEPSERARGKFSAGNKWEGIIQNVFRRLGFLVELTVDEKRVKTELPGMIPVSGKIDILLNGTKTIDEISQIRATTILKLSRLIYDDPLIEEELKETIRMANTLIAIGKTVSFSNEIVEVKSASLMSFDMIVESNAPHDSHGMQAGYYVRYNKKWNKKSGLIIYVCKDDSRYHIIEISGAKNSKYQKMLVDSWKRKSSNYLKKKKPDKEPLIIAENGRFKLNFNVMYSNYLTMLYGYAHQEEYREAHSGKISSWNRVITRMAKEEKMTKSNEEYIKEMKKMGYKPEKMAYQIQQILKNKEEREIL